MMLMQEGGKGERGVWVGGVALCQHGVGQQAEPGAAQGLGEEEGERKAGQQALQTGQPGRRPTRWTYQGQRIERGMSQHTTPSSSRDR